MAGVTQVDAVITGRVQLGTPPALPGATAPVLATNAGGEMTFEDPAAGGPYTLSMLAGLSALLILPVVANAAAAIALYGGLLAQGSLAMFTNLGAAGQPGYYDGAAWRRFDTNGLVP